MSDEASSDLPGNGSGNEDEKPLPKDLDDATGVEENSGHVEGSQSEELAHSDLGFVYLPGEDTAIPVPIPDTVEISARPSSERPIHSSEELVNSEWLETLAIQFEDTERVRAEAALQMAKDLSQLVLKDQTATVISSPRDILQGTTNIDESLQKYKAMTKGRQDWFRLIFGASVLVIFLAAYIYMACNIVVVLGYRNVGTWGPWLFGSFAAAIVGGGFALMRRK